MKTDRELLELAAKAAGLQEWGWMSGTLTHIVNNQFVFWNPLTDDGDALRLAVKLRLHIGLESHAVSAWSPHTLGKVRDAWSSEECTPEEADAATRLAIVRAAAAIGEQMP